MRAWTTVVAIAFAGPWCVASAAAQPSWTYRARVSFEAHAARTNVSSPLVPPGSAGWDPSQLFVAAADTSWEHGSRLRIAGGAVASGAGAAGASLRARELYLRVGATSWMDLEAGKRLVRWGVGYGYSPTGVLDPPRSAIDPSDRLGRNDGMPLVRADLFRGDTSFSIALASPALWRDVTGPASPSRVVAARLRTVVRGGLELAFVGSAAPGRLTSVGGNVTHVVGQRLEWHAEWLVHEDARAPSVMPSDLRGAGADPAASPAGRTLSAVAGLQYTLPGVNLVMEYHRQRTDGSPGAPRGNLLFFRAARAGADVRLAPELIVFRGIDDGDWTAVAGLGWTVRRRVELYARMMQLTGPRTSRAGLAPVSGTLTLGATARF